MSEFCMARSSEDQKQSGEYGQDSRLQYTCRTSFRKRRARVTQEEKPAAVHCGSTASPTGLCSHYPASSMKRDEADEHLCVTSVFGQRCSLRKSGICIVNSLSHAILYKDTCHSSLR